MRIENYERNVILREERRKAREEILQAVNNYKRKRRPWRPNHYPTLLSMKNINEAVHIARRKKLVKPTTLEKAGFNANN